MRKKFLLFITSFFSFITFAFPTYASSNRPAATYTINNRKVYVYGRPSTLHQKRKVPLILFMHGTGGDPQKEVIASGWAAKARQSNLIVISPSYNDYVTYDNVPSITRVVRYAQRHYSVDQHRTYSLGFSNGGATSIAMASRHPRMFAGIAAYGWANNMERSSSNYPIPFQFISGSREATEHTKNGHPMVRVDVRTAIRSLFRYNQMSQANLKTNYRQTPYWGYRPDSSTQQIVNNTKWTINNYQKDGYRSPFAQFILINRADHRSHRAEATYSWDFLKHFSRNSAGQIVDN
ncbi:prolyl oligopeptidase family serine peptidase [Limosilactobacillus reuteri]|uniref:alpha/beta hydrolase family esterase n=1 Tax=Limosilactobacillus reuteri TaxID=1598 RepID=UPI001E3DE191|nr:prolyl oligopeptidase family serine peptidase [Limosilactobacillus reuteri]MCC4422521.1 prolyl oligopeptidase family serine peptidase [Limosilactobacillus reuteri]